MKPLVSVFFFLLFSITGIFGNANARYLPATLHSLRSSCMGKTGFAGAAAVKTGIDSNNAANNLSYIGEDEDQEETVRQVNASRYLITCFYLSFIQIQPAFTKHGQPFCKTAYTASPIYIRHRVIRI